MPTSFSRVLNEDDLAEVRNQYLAALAALEAEDDADDEPGTGEELETDEESGAGA